MSRFRTLSALRAVFANHDLRRVEFAWVLFVMAKWGTKVATLVFAYERGGAAETGLMAVIQLVPAAIVAPLASVIGDRMRRDRALLAGYCIQAAAVAGTAAAMFADAPIAVVYGLMVVVAMSMTLTRPVQSALIPQLTHSPDELIAANVVAGSEYGAMTLFGPLTAGVLIGVSGPALALTAFAILLLGAALLVVHLELHPHPAPSHRRPLSEAAAGFRSVLREPRHRLVVGLMFLLSVTAGALDVLTIVVGLGQLGLPPSAAGYLAAARGGGGLLGGLWTLRLVAHPRLAAAMATGLLLYGAATASLGLVVVIAMAVLLQVAAGAGYARSEMSGRTLLQRLVPDDVLARVFGVLEGVSQAGQAAGAALAPILVALLGIRGGTLVAGFLLPVAVLIRLSRLRAIDRTAEIPERELSVLRSVDMFAPLSPHHFEGLAARVHDVASPAGTVIIRQGTPGDRLYVIADGEVEVTRDGWPVATLGSGDYVGEISLLRDTPHNATVTATTPVALLELERADFIELMTNELVAREAADLTAEERTPPGPS